MIASIFVHFALLIKKREEINDSGGELALNIMNLVFWNLIKKWSINSTQKQKIMPLSFPALFENKMKTLAAFLCFELKGGVTDQHLQIYAANVARHVTKALTSTDSQT